MTGKICHIALAPHAIAAKRPTAYRALAFGVVLAGMLIPGIVEWVLS
jgi:hypothetical protein